MLMTGADVLSSQALAIPPAWTEVCIADNDRESFHRIPADAARLPDSFSRIASRGTEQSTLGFA
jgi:hypothetical protein